MAETKDLLVTLEDLKVVHDDHVSKFAGKVDKVDGKGLSSNDYDDAAKAKVDAIPDNPKYTDTVYNDSELQEAVNQLNSNLQSTVGNLSELNTQEKTSLVAAINEALTKSGGEIAPDDVQRIVEDYLKANPPGTGTDGKDGITPTIGENGNWYLGDTDTGKPSRGTTGVPGKDGAKGKDGADGKGTFRRGFHGEAGTRNPEWHNRRYYPGAGSCSGILWQTRESTVYEQQLWRYVVYGIQYIRNDGCNCISEHCFLQQYIYTS